VLYALGFEALDEDIRRLSLRHPAIDITRVSLQPRYLGPI
jgi:hypothetical protein